MDTSGVAVDPTPTIPLTAVFMSLSWITLALRSYARIGLLGKMHPEDWVIILCLLFYTIFAVGTLESARLIEVGEGKEVSPRDVAAAILWSYIQNIFYIPTTFTLKISISLFFLRVTVNKRIRIYLFILVGLTTAMSIWALFLIIFHCGTFSTIQELIYKRMVWDCASPELLVACVYVHAGSVALLDWSFVVIPIIMLRGMDITRREKCTIGPLMMLVSVGGIASLVRLKYCTALGLQGTSVLAGTKDLGIWSFLEASVGICAANIACLRLLFRRHIMPLARFVYHAAGNDHQSVDRSFTNETANAKPSLLMGYESRKDSAQSHESTEKPLPSIPIVLDTQSCTLPKKAYLPTPRALENGIANLNPNPFESEEYSGLKRISERTEPEDEGIRKQHQ